MHSSNHIFRSPVLEYSRKNLTLSKNNLQNLEDQERELITQLNVPQFRDFMSKVFGPQFGAVMQEGEKHWGCQE